MPYIYPRNFEIREIEQDLITASRDGRVGLDIFPERNVNAGEVRWTQEDNYYGLQQFRGLDGEPTHVQRVGLNTFSYEPGVFGEFVTVTEEELTKRAGTAPLDTTPIDISDLVLGADRLLIGREFDRMESSVWSILTTGTLSLSKPGPNNSVIQYTDTYPIQTYTAGVAFSNLSTATPIAAFQSVQQMQVGHSVDLGAGAVAYANQKTLNYILNNSNTADFGGRRTQFGATINNLAALNSYWQSQNLPRLVAYDGGYFGSLSAAQSQSTSQFTKFIPDNKIVVVGKRPGGAKVGEYQMTRNLNNPGGAPGKYRYLIDRANGVNGEKRTPPNMEVHRGHNGGPAILYPSAVVLMNV